MDILLSDRAFAGLIVSSIEVYKDECLGSLLGYQTPNRIVVEHVIPYQTAKRKPTEVEPNWRRESKIRGIVSQIMHLQYLGSFHSHTQWGGEKASPGLSEQDKESMNSGEVEIVVAVNEARRVRKWYQSGREIHGSVGRYHLTIAGYYKRKRDEQIKRYQVVCPYALGFDYNL